MEHSENIKQFFGILRKKGLYPGKMSRTVANWTLIEMEDFFAECEELTPYADRTRKPMTIFDFAATGSLSGDAYPCSHIECRLRKVDQLARFAALYADHILVLNPLALSPSELGEDSTRARFIDDMQILYYIKPLLEAGLIGLVPRHLAFCAEHFREFEQVEQRLTRAARSVIRRHLSKIDISFEQHGDLAIVRLEGPEKLFEHSPALMLTKGDTAKLRKRRKITFVMDHISPVLRDLLWQNTSKSESYLTSRELDLDLVQAINDTETHNASQTLLDSFSHTVPFIHQVDIQRLIKLRQSEGEAFQVYRDSLSAALKSASESDTGNLRELFNDQVLPELHKMDLTIKNSRKLLFGSIATDLIVSAGFIGIGLFSGLLPAGVGELLAVLGGYSFVKELSEQVAELMREPPSIRDSKYYFLWKVQKEASRSK